MIRFPHALAAASLVLVASGFASTAIARPTLTPAQKEQAAALRDACGDDYRRLCAGVRPGGGRVLQCFETHVAELSPTCRAALDDARRLRAETK